MYDATFKIILYSAPDVDKSTLSKKFLTKIFESYSMLTIGVEFNVKSLETYENKVKLQIWDFTGEDRFRILLPTYVLGANGGILIYNIKKDTSVSEISKWVNFTKKLLRKEADYDFPVILIGNNSNLVEKKIYFYEPFLMGNLFGVDGYIECCIETGVNLETAFRLLKHLMMREPIKEDFFDLIPEKNWESSVEEKVEKIQIQNEELRNTHDRSLRKRVRKYLRSVLHFRRE